MSAALRYLLVFELHFLMVGSADKVVVRTHRRWIASGAQPRALHEVLTDGVEISRREVTGSEAVERLTVELDDLADTVTPITDHEARARIAAYTGITYPEHCPRASCGAPVPVGSQRCGEWDSLGQVGNGGWTGIRNRPPLILRTGGDQ